MHSSFLTLQTPDTVCVKLTATQKKLLPWRDLKSPQCVRTETKYPGNKGARAQSCAESRHWLEDDDSNKRDYEPYAACRRQGGWLQSPISGLNEALTLARKQFHTFSFFFPSYWQCWWSEVGWYTTTRLFTAMTLDWDWSRDTSLKRPSFSLVRTKHDTVPDCERRGRLVLPKVKTLLHIMDQGLLYRTEFPLGCKSLFRSSQDSSLCGHFI